MDPNQQPPSPHPAPTPEPDLAYIRNLDSQIHTLRLQADTLQTSLFELVDTANNLHFTTLDAETSSTPPHIVQQKKLQLATQIRDLEAQEDVNNQAVSKLRKELDEYWEAYASSSCRALCDAVRLKLPRELRMMVCEMVWGVTEHSVTSWVMNRPGPAIHDAAHEIETWSQRGRAHCLDAGFVGAELQAEMSEAWWAASVFRFESLDVLEWFLSGEFEAFGVRGKVRKVLVGLWYREYRAWVRSVRLKGEVMAGEKGGDVEGAMGVLHSLGKTTEIVLVVKRKDGNYRRDAIQVRQQEFLTSASRMFPALGRLQREGYRVSVEIGRGIEIKVGSEISVEEWVRQIDAAIEVLGNTHPYDTDCWPRLPLPSNGCPVDLPYPLPGPIADQCGRPRR